MNNSVSTMSGKTKLKIVFLGNQYVGKSSIIEKYVKDVFDESSNPTVGIDFLVKNVPRKGKNYRLQLWDTAGQERFRSLIPNYLKDAKCALIVIDVTNKASLNGVENWLNLYNNNKTGDGFAFLVGNKVDLDGREVSREEGKKKAEEMGIPYFELSAKTGQNVENLFNKLIDTFQDSSSNSGGRRDTEKNGENQIKQNAEQQQQDANKNKNTGQPEPQPASVQNTNVILKNEKIVNESKKQQGNKGCC